MRTLKYTALVLLLFLTSVRGVEALSTASRSFRPRRGPPTRFITARCFSAPAAPTRSGASSRLQSTRDEQDSSNEKGSRGPRRNPLVAVRRAWLRFVSYWTRLGARFSALPRKAKMLVAAQLLVFSLLAGVSVKRIVAQGGSPYSARRANAPVEVPYSTFLDFVEGKDKDQVQIANVQVGVDRIGYRIFRFDNDQQRRALAEALEGKKPAISIPQRSAFTRKIPASPELVQYLRQHKLPFSAAPSKTNVLALSVRTFLLAFYALLLLRMYRTMSGGGAGGGAPGKLAKSSGMPLASFDEIEGIDNAKYEVMELVDTLRNPSKYAILGARAPTGLLMEGPPGTGKTMLARATAATAGVPLLYCSGSDFVEMFVGRGAARVRKTFEKAAKLAPCIIFIDELDALGKSRDTGYMANMGRSNDEAEQTLNQLLACMDGLDSSRRVCVMAATNRREVLDQALVRPGRFDRIIKLELPNVVGRERILRVHAKKLPGFKEGKGVDDRRIGSLGIGPAVDLSAIAAVTPGLSGAELEFIVNEAAIRAVRRVSATLRQGGDPTKLSASVEAVDFEESVKDFFLNRKPRGPGVGDLFGALRK